MRRKCVRLDTSTAEKFTEVKQKKDKMVGLLRRLLCVSGKDGQGEALRAPHTQRRIMLAKLACPEFIPTMRKKEAMPPESRYLQPFVARRNGLLEQLAQGALFFKPMFSMRGQVSRPANGKEVDEQFWTRAATEHAVGLRAQEEVSDETDNSVMPFNTRGAWASWARSY